MTSFHSNIDLLVQVLIILIALCRGAAPANSSFVYTGCGISGDASGFRILGPRREAKAGEYPWIVYLKIRDAGRVIKSYISCTGTIIGEKHVLTAGRCIQREPLFNQTFLQAPPSYISVLTGSLFPARGKARTVDKVYLHPDYDTYQLHNDIAVLRLTEPITWNPNESPVCLSQSENVTSDSDNPCRIVGWGRVTSHRSGYPLRLRWGTDPLISHEKCREKHGNLVDEGAFCGEGGVNQGFCTGDIGGPYICKRGTRWYQCGIASNILGKQLEEYRTVCAEERKYTNVGYYYDWIVAKMNES